ncbi:thiamine biosynthesis protein ThiJ [Pseudoduganella sp. FT93W]|uniref:Thiamine biosynthesis protein ThiJ n=1 Tax=Duganella fentianensis TaxID=2692177 RepID=A0A845HRJ3_9BURK|nr:DJ-1/PfpI family protein [Duganella fentianensis]MYN43600.1 thiamine biosynthesis protein ThiJ [Duganella fentianensis]
MYNISIIVFDQFTDIDFFLMRDILGRTNTDWRVRVLGTKSTHSSALGTVIQTDGHLAEANSADAVLFVSGQQGVPAALADPAFMSAFQLNPQKQLIGSVCAGSFILCELGLLDGLPATTHPDAQQGLVAMGVQVIDQALVVAGNIATTGGCLAALYLTGWLAEQLVGVAKRREIHRQLLPAGQSEVFEALVQQTIAAATLTVPLEQAPRGQPARAPHRHKATIYGAGSPNPNDGEIVK